MVQIATTERDLYSSRILILDFGSQYTQLIGRRVREAQVYCEIVPYDVSHEFVREFKPSGIILSGGPESVNTSEEFKAPDFIFGLEIPILGICYGMQTMARQLGGSVALSSQSEFGYATVRARGHSRPVSYTHLRAHET